jgi:hypothetical protein
MVAWQRGLGRRIRAALLAAAVAVIVTVGNPTAGHSRASLETWTAVIAMLGPALVLCVVGAWIWSGTVGAVLLAVVSGALWGVFAVLTKGADGRVGARRDVEARGRRLADADRRGGGDGAPRRSRWPAARRPVRRANPCEH